MLAAHSSKSPGILACCSGDCTSACGRSSWGRGECGRALFEQDGHDLASWLQGECGRATWQLAGVSPGCCHWDLRCALPRPGCCPQLRWGTHLSSRPCWGTHNVVLVQGYEGGVGSGCCNRPGGQGSRRGACRRHIHVHPNWTTGKYAAASAPDAAASYLLSIQQALLLQLLRVSCVNQSLVMHF